MAGGLGAGGRAEENYREEGGKRKKGEGEAVGEFAREIRGRFVPGKYTGEIRGYWVVNILGVLRRREGH